MKKVFSLGMLFASMLFVACSTDDGQPVNSGNTQSNATEVKNIAANFGSGEMTVSTIGGTRVGGTVVVVDSNRVNVTLDFGDCLQIQDDWYVQADDFAIHNGDKLYLPIVDRTSDGHQSVGAPYIKVNWGNKVTIDLKSFSTMYTKYKKATTEKTPYIDESGILTTEVYLWPSKLVAYGDADLNHAGLPKIEPLAREDGFIVPEDGYLIGKEKEPAVYTTDKFRILVSAYAGYNNGDNKTSYVKVSIHMVPLDDANEK